MRILLDVGSIERCVVPGDGRGAHRPGLVAAGRGRSRAGAAARRRPQSAVGPAANVPPGPLAFRLHQLEKVSRPFPVSLPYRCLVLEHDVLHFLINFQVIQSSRTPSIVVSAWFYLGGLITEFYRVLPSFTGFYRVLLGFYWVLLCSAGFYLVLK